MLSLRHFSARRVRQAQCFCFGLLTAFLFRCFAFVAHSLCASTLCVSAGDDILDSLLASVCLEVGDVCDKYVERVFDAEFEIDLEQMAEQDWNEQIQLQQQQQQQQPFPQEQMHEQQPVQ